MIPDDFKNEVQNQWVIPCFFLFKFAKQGTSNVC